MRDGSGSRATQSNISSIAAVQQLLLFLGKDGTQAEKAQALEQDTNAQAFSTQCPPRGMEGHEPSTLRRARRFHGTCRDGISFSPVGHGFRLRQGNWKWLTGAAVFRMHQRPHLPSHLGDGADRPHKSRFLELTPAFDWQSGLGTRGRLFHKPFAPLLVQVWKRDAELPRFRPNGRLVPLQRQRCTRDAGTLLAQSYQLLNVLFTPLLGHGLPSTVSLVSARKSAGPAEKFPAALERGSAVRT